jgi:uncharacterized protein (DUF305 family)
VQWLPNRSPFHTTEGTLTMKKKALAVSTAVVAAVLVLAGCSSSGNDQARQTPASTSPSATQPHNHADVMFARHMIPHHQQAIQMSDTVLAKQGIDARVVDLANTIKAAQGPEIEAMQSWLSQWAEPTMSMMPGMMPAQSPMPTQSGAPHHSGQPSAGMTPSQTMMPSGTVTPGVSMMPSGTVLPGMEEGMMGMMSDADMTALQNAQGVDASKLFLQQMISHHQGAITMAQTEIDTGQYAAAVDLARSIATSQQQEINTMQGILASL